jgi:ABC-type proline/glycine betaine transport system permease subunit
MTVTSEDAALAPVGQQEPEGERRSGLRRVLASPAAVWGYIGIPLIVIISWIVLYYWVAGQELDRIEAPLLTWNNIRGKMLEHIQLSVIATVFIIAIAVPLGMLLTRRFAKPVTPLFVGLANIGQAIPSIGVIFFLALPFLLGIGPQTAIVAVIIYCILPVLRNTMVGIDQVDRSLIESARGMGMTKRAVLLRIELPLAIPVILAGIRTALILAVGTMTLATFINAGGLGDIINQGIVQNRDSILVTGAVLTAGLALLIDWIASIAEEVFRPKGL